ncbi:endonuclease/exonuclease/phosphatase (plasmid) [Peptoclostridium acidaminophilum DSM 3953]|uniref:Endonuclease/exonuclease/phosphatase n=1 Tax=Peptoclostridium acidaminophilum DSM 3953 TaxID=1286171 RepID=W8TJD8_PEPAC|nr:endonuclease/exonuclease/phosphatase family protein [Peptoclostridium acidaminophilum]AHM57913.1 endonuclease/exonuclease/phosphatase [Peptoclostridium acidaminophilum DSM 3953]
MPTLRIATYNIKCGHGMDGKLDLKRTARALEALGADVICLQEVDMNRARTLYANQALKFAGLLGMEYSFGAAIKYSGGGAYGNAILSRHPIVQQKNHRLPGQGSKRAIQEVQVEVEGSRIAIFNTHMELDQEQRLQQIEGFIVPLVSSYTGPAVLCGDFNEKPQSPGIRCLSRHFKDSLHSNSGKLTLTFPADIPKSRIDYIFLNSKCRALDYKIVNSIASDHLPVLALVEF